MSTTSIALLEKKQEYLVRRIAPESGYSSLLKFPSYFEIETVNACNARCPMCTIGDWQRHSPVMKDDLFKKIADEISEHADHVKRVSLYRDGEPLLDKRLPDRIAYLKAAGIKRVGIATNVSLLDERRATNILKAGIDEVIMSVDSLQKNVFEEMRHGLEFETVLENALGFVRLRDRLRPQTSIWVRMVVGENNANEWPSYRDYWAPRLNDHDRLYYHSMHNWGGQIGVATPRLSYEPTLPCVALWSLMVIFSNGDVPLCNVDYNNKFPTGDVRQSSIAEVWQSAVLAQRRRQHLGGEKAAISLCTNCNVWDEQGNHDAEFLSAQYGSAQAVRGAE